MLCPEYAEKGQLRRADGRSRGVSIVCNGVNRTNNRRRCEYRSCFWIQNADGDLPDSGRSPSFVGSDGSELSAVSYRPGSAGLDFPVPAHRVVSVFNGSGAFTKLERSKGIDHDSELVKSFSPNGGFHSAWLRTVGMAARVQ